MSTTKSKDTKSTKPTFTEPRFPTKDPGPEDKAPQVREVDSVAYWCGTFPDSPFINLEIGGVDFHHVTEKVVDAPGSYKTRRYPSRGSIQYLSPEKAEGVRKAAEDLVVRRRGPVATMLRKSDRRYRAHVGDKPIGEFVYFLTVDDAVSNLGANWRESEPPSLI